MEIQMNKEEYKYPQTIEKTNEYENQSNTPQKQQDSTKRTIIKEFKTG